MKTIGSKDIVSHRKKRSDKGKRRERYAGKKTKPKRKVNGNFIPYKSNRLPSDPIKVWFQEKRKMSKIGYMKFPPKMRSKLDKTVKPFIGKPSYVYPDEISTPEKMGEFAIRILQYAGLFNWMMPTHSKSSYRVSYKKKAVVRITETESGLVADVFNYSMMKHYKWFWRGK